MLRWYNLFQRILRGALKAHLKRIPSSSGAGDCTPIRPGSKIHRESAAATRVNPCEDLGGADCYDSRRIGHTASGILRRRGLCTAGTCSCRESGSVQFERRLWVPGDDACRDHGSCCAQTDMFGCNPVHAPGSLVVPGVSNRPDCQDAIESSWF